MSFFAAPDLRLYFDVPTPIFRARINMPGTITYPVTELTFDTVTLGTFDVIQPDMTLILGTTLGADDLGRVRVQNVATSSTIPVGRISQGPHDGELNIQDNAYIEVWEDYRVWAKIPYSSPAGVDYKDANVEVGDFNEEMPPVANCGPGAAGYVDADTELFTVTLPAGGVNQSYAMADGATITGYAWDLKGGTATVGDVDEDVLTATFPPGKYWVTLTVTDSNGKQHTSRCVVLAIDPDDDPTLPFVPESWESTQAGVTFAFRLLENTPRSTHPDGGLVILFDGNPFDADDRSNIWFYGWHQSDSFALRATAQGLTRQTTLNCVDLAGRLAALPAFPQALQREAEDDVDIMWSLMPGLDMRKCLWYLLHWHSTAGSLGDFLMPDELADYPSMRLDSSGGNLYDQINSRAQSCVPDHWLTCNWSGQLLVRPDWMLLDVDDRPVDTAGTLTEDFWSDIQVDYNRPPRVYVLNSSAVVCSTEWLQIGGEDTLPLAFCKAPGYAFGQGVSEATTGEKLTISQEQLNACEGHRYARLNARYGLFNIVEPTGDIQDFQPAHMLPVQLNISAATAAQRGLDFTTARGIVKRVSRRFNVTEQGVWVSPTIQWEREVVGLPAVTHNPEVPEEPDYEVPDPPPPTTPPDFGLVDGQQVLTGIGSNGKLYQTTDFQTDSGSGGPTYNEEDLGTGDIYSFVVDPFSPGYAPGATSGSVDGWVVNDTDIYRVENLHGTPVVTSVHTFATATVAASFHWRSIQASFGAFFAEGANPWLLCVSYYGDTSGHEGTWATYSTDGGATWAAEVQVSAHYHNGPLARFNPVGVYTSPKTPGLAYTVAHIATGMYPLLDGFVSTDWGETWSRVSEDVDESDSAYIPLMYGSRRYQGAGDNETSIFLMGFGTSASMVANAVQAPGMPGVEEDAAGVMFFPHPDTKRMSVGVTWSATEMSGTVASASTDLDAGGTLVTQTGSLNFVSPSGPGTTSGGGSVTWEKSGTGDWPRNSVNRLATPPTTHVDGCYIDAYGNASGFGSITAVGKVTFTVVVTEIELEDGTIINPPLLRPGFIQPGRLHAGSIHLPWPDNADEQLAYYGYFDLTPTRQFRLKRAQGTTITDISPSAAGVIYGVNRYGFAVRSHDSNRQYVVASVIGNETSSDPADDLHAVYVSSDNGDTWIEVVAPIADSGAPAGRPAFEAAFGGDSEDVIFIFGPAEYISYSSDFGVTVDDRSGNLASFSPSGWIGICGGTS